MGGFKVTIAVCIILIALLVSGCASYELKPVEEAEEMEQTIEEAEELMDLEKEAEDIEIEYEEPAEEEKEVEEYKQPEPEETAEEAEPEETEETVPEGVDPEIAEIRKAGESTDDIHYFYRELGGRFDDCEVFIRGNKMRLKFSSLQSDEKDSYTQIFIDFSDETAKAVCADGIKCSMNFNQPFDIDFDRFLRLKTPMHWAKQIPYSARFTGTTTFMGRNVKSLEYGNVEMQVYDFYNLPAKVKTAGKSYSFEIFKTTCPERDVTIGGVLI
ncbi:hypothetical protein GF371_02210 [Candidatus Woesearchaeota archaeon]|nr:hypothetical protein [Candidatus Woesearchaeota archaeon]